jgi:hypothetical protein
MLLRKVMLVVLELLAVVVAQVEMLPPVIETVVLELSQD